MKYSSERREAVITKMLAPNSKSISDLSREEGIPVTTLYHWRRNAQENRRASSGGAKKRSKREERAEEIRRALFTAAAKVVGKHGYQGASITRITKEAGVANGTFYNYFRTRQQLFDCLLPDVGEQLLAYIRNRVGNHQSGLERETQRIQAYVDFFEENPGFSRVLNEAEVYSPKAFKAHVDRYVSNYLKALKYHQKQGELTTLFDPDELKAIVYMLLGARTYLAMHWKTSAPRLKDRASAKASLVEAYVKIIGEGLFKPSDHDINRQSE